MRQHTVGTLGGGSEASFSTPQVIFEVGIIHNILAGIGSSLGIPVKCAIALTQFGMKGIGLCNTSPGVNEISGLANYTSCGSSSISAIVT